MRFARVGVAPAVCMALAVSPAVGGIRPTEDPIETPTPPTPTPTPPPDNPVAPPAPTGLRAKATRKLVKAWWDPTSGASSYVVTLTARVGDGWRDTKETKTTDPRYRLRVVLRPGSGFKYCVRSVSPQGLWSSRVCVKGRAPQSRR